MTERTRRRLATVALAPAAALTTWAAARLAGAGLTLKSGGSVGAADVFASAVAAAVAGWFVVRLLERHTRRPRYWWSLVASTALAVSITGPSWLADGTSAVVLITLHIVTGVVVITGLARTLPDGGCGVDLRRPRPENTPAR